MKRILAITLALLLCLGLVPVSVLGEQTNSNSIPAFVVIGGKADCGETVTVTVATQNNPGIVSLKVKVGYDASVLQLNDMQGADFADVTFGPLTKNPVTVNWMNSLENNNTTNGVVAVLTFTVLDGVAYGETPITLTYDPNDVFDYDYNNVEFAVENGVVTVGCTHKNTVTVPAKASTCLEQGHGEYTYCQKCETLLSGSKDLLDFGDHDFTKEDPKELYKVSDATCTEKAVYYHSCTLCGEKGTSTFVVGDMDASNHSGEIITVPAQDSTCIAQGHKEYSYCEDCKTVVNGSDEALPFGDHNYSAQVVSDKYKVSDATCTEKAVYYYSCTLCGVAGNATFTAGEVNPENHGGTLVTVPAKDSTCLVQGHGEYTYCDQCDTLVQGSDEPLPFGDHDFTNEDTEDCYKVSDATCTEKAVYYYSCTLCGETGETTFTFGLVDKTNHVGGTHLEGEKEPTFEAPGYTGDLCCDACGDLLSSGEELPQLQKPSGLVQDGDVYRYLIDGQAQSGWFEIDGEWYYFFEDTLCAKEGSFKIGVVTYEFEVTGKLKSGVWGKTLFGTRYYYGPDYYRNGWLEIEGASYYFQDGYRYEGIRMVQDGTLRWLDFGANGVCSTLQVEDGFYTDALGCGYSKNGIALVGTQCIEDAYYYFNAKGYAQKNGVYDGRLYQDDYKAYSGGLVKDGKDYLYKDGKAAPTGLYKIDGDYYYVGWDGSMQTNGRYYTDATFCDLPIGNYTFGADGKMLQGFVVMNGVTYMYTNGNTSAVGLYKVDGGYYFVDWGGIVRANGRYYVEASYCDLPANANYTFGADGRMLNGMAVVDGVTYLYANGTTATYGLYQIDGDYYFSEWGGIMMADGRYYVTTSYCDLPANQNYSFGPDGKMLNGIVEVDGTLYHYVNGSTSVCGFFKVDGDYYWVDWGGIVKTDGRYYVDTTYCDLPANQNYSFGPEGKMLNGVVNVDGTLYYYINGSTSVYGLFNIDGDYYLADWGGIIRTNGRHYIDVSYCDLPANQNYSFGPDGKMLNGVVDVNGTLYYYVNGSTSTYGLFNVDGNYYFADWGGIIRTNGTYFVDTSYCDLPAGEYTFGADGKMLQGFVDEGDTTYYYVNGRKPAPGVICVNGDYYFVSWNGVIIKNQTFYVFNGNGYTIEMNYTFDENGKIIG